MDVRLPNGALLAAVIAAFVLASCDPPPPEITSANFEQGALADLDLNQPTAMTIGTDGRLYISELEGRILAITLDPSGRTAREIEEIANAEDFNQILGITADPTTSETRIYVSHNFVNGTAPHPFPNEIIRLAAPDFVAETVISGLPVSGHNHGTNALAFTEDGRLLIAQGGTTSTGAPSDANDRRWLDWDETPLSGAFLVADVQRDGFDGNVTYDSNLAASTTNQVTGDVRVFSPGHRNTYGFVVHTNGNVYSLDNGSSEPVARSIDCDTLGPPPENDPDQLNLVVEDGYYGHPNRNRGRSDQRQCVYRDPAQENNEENMLRLVPPSSNAIIEFRGSDFGGEWNGDLVYAWWSGGEVRRLLLSSDGASIEGEEVITSGLSLPLAMVQHPETGIIYVAEFGSGTVTFLAPAG